MHMQKKKGFLDEISIYNCKNQNTAMRFSFGNAGVINATKYT